MSFKEILIVPSNHQIVIQLSDEFSSNDKVLITVESISNRAAKMEMMRKAAKDYHFIEDVNLVSEDFEKIDGEGL